MNKKLLFVIICLAMSMLACSITTVGSNTVTGSGKVASETRSVSAFDTVELAGSADVDISFGSNPSVVIKADDNILPLIKTSASNGRLRIENKAGTNIVTSHPIQVSIVMPSLKGIDLSGSGNIQVNNMEGNDMQIQLPGSGTITVTGTADSVDISLPGSGNINADGLKAKSATVNLPGSGNISVYASDSLNARIPGSGTIRYAGNPAQVNKSISGSGNITP